MESHANYNQQQDFDWVDIDDTDEEWTEPLNSGRRDSTHHYSIDYTADFTDHSTFVSKIGHRRTVIHFDIDCFYAQVEMLRNPELRNKPLGVQQKNLVITTNYVARNCGVPKSSYVTDAKKICPDLVLVCGEDLTNYRQMSYQISEFLQRYSPNVERLGFDENFIDVSELVATRLKDGKYKEEFAGHVYGSCEEGISKPLCSCGCDLRIKIGSQIAADIREALYKELNITCCAGVGCNKLIAKLVAGTHKPNQQTSVLPNMAVELVSSLTSVLCIPGIGYRTSSRLNALGISSVQDLQSSDKKVLEKEFGPNLAQIMVQLSYGVDDSPVIAYSQPQTLSDEDAFKCCNDLADAEHRIRDLLASLMKRVLEDGRVPQTIRLTVRRIPNKYRRESKQCPVPGNIFATGLQDCMTEATVERLMQLLMSLFCKLVDQSKPFHLTLISIGFAKLVKPADEQGTIGAFFTRGDTFSQHAAVNLDLNEKVIDNQCRDAFQSGFQTKSSPLKSEVKTKLNNKMKTITHFFLKNNNANIGTKAAMKNCLVTSGEKASQDTFPRSQIDTLLPLVDVKERSVSNDISQIDNLLPLVDVKERSVSNDISQIDNLLPLVDVKERSVSNDISQIDNLLPLVDVKERSVSNDTSQIDTLLPLVDVKERSVSNDISQIDNLLPLVDVKERSVSNDTSQIDNILPLVDVKERSVSNDTSNNVNNCSRTSSELDRVEICLTDCKSGQSLETPVAEIPHRKGQGENISDISDRSDINAEVNNTTVEKCLQKLLPADVDTTVEKCLQNLLPADVDTSVEKCLQNLLPADVDAHTVAGLPRDIQIEVLIQYGIFVEELPQGRRFTKMSDKIRTRSYNTHSVTTVKDKKTPDNPKEKNTLKRNQELCMLDDGSAVRISKKRKILLTVEESNIDTLTSQHLDVGKVVESSTEISSDSLSKTYAMDTSFPCITDQQCFQDDELSSTNCCLIEKNVDLFDVEKLRKNNLDDLSQCSRGISVSPCKQPAILCVSHDQHTHTPFVNCNTENVDIDTSQNEHDISADFQKPFLNVSVINETPQTSKMPGYSVPTQPYQRSLREARNHKLPTNIDTEVFSSLPSNIQGEIMAHLMMGTSDKPGGQDIINTIPEHPRNKEHNKNIKQKNQNTLLTYFKKR